MSLSDWRVRGNGLRLALAAASLVSVLAAAPTRAADWPQWRGPDRDGVSKETGLLKQWPKEGPPLAWKATGLGTGHSSVSVAKGRIYTMGDGPDGNYVHALDEKSGKHLWSTKLGKAGGGGDQTPARTGTRCTPTVDGDKLFVLGQYGELACLTTDGKEVWRKDLVKEFGGVVQRWGYSESPLVDGDKVICTPGGSKGTLLALDKNSGKVLWQSKELTDPAQYSTPIIATIGGVRQYGQQTM